MKKINGIYPDYKLCFPGYFQGLGMPVEWVISRQKDSLYENI